MTKMMLMSQKKSKGKVTKGKISQATKGSIQMKPYYHLQKSGSKAD